MSNNNSAHSNMKYSFVIWCEAQLIQPFIHGSRTCHARAMMHVGIANPVAGKTFPAFPAHAQPAILRIW